MMVAHPQCYSTDVEFSMDCQSLIKNVRTTWVQRAHDTVFVLASYSFFMLCLR